MKVIHARNVHQALPLALAELMREGVLNDSRNGPVMKFNEPVTTVYAQPRERVLFWAQRECNPFFHLFESLWMLAGRRDVEYVARYVSTMRNFSDDGVTFHGAYGYRWRQWFGQDQLKSIVEAFRKDKTDRRQVLSMWDAPNDLGKTGKDFPCNLQCLFAVNAAGQLDMIVTNRSNDMVWGAYGANAVHFSYLLEYMATQIGIPVGRYWQVSANFHSYLGTLGPVAELATKVDVSHEDPYALGEVSPYPLMSVAPERWDEELLMFLENPFTLGLRDPFFRKVALPAHRAFEAYRGGQGVEKYTGALVHIADIQATDWRTACREWIVRRRVKFLAKTQGGDQHG